jgi:hypothetical protein
MPGDPNQMQWIAAADLDQRFRGCDDFHKPPILQRQRIAAAQHRGILEIEQEFKPPRRRHRHPSPVAIVEIEHNGIGGRLVPAMPGQDSGGSDHVNTLTVSRPCRR